MLFLAPTVFKTVLAAGQVERAFVSSALGAWNPDLSVAALDIGERKSLALTLYQADFAINHVVNVVKHEYTSLFNFWPTWRAACLLANFSLKT